MVSMLLAEIGFKSLGSFDGNVSDRELTIASTSHNTVRNDSSSSYSQFSKEFRLRSCGHF